MGKVALDCLEVGMVIAADVRDRAGRLLLGAGAELTPKHLIVLRTWGVAHVEVVGADDEACVQLQDEVTRELLEDAEELLAPLFQHANVDHPAMRELLRLAALRKVLHEA